MRYYKPISFALMFLVLALLALCFAPGCAMLDLIGQPQKTFELTIDGQKVILNLPDEIPDLENAIVGWHQCWNAHLCGIGYDLMDKCCIHYVNFWYSGKTVFGIVYVDKRTGVKVLLWFYDNGKLTPTTEIEFNAKIEELYKHPPK